MQDDTDAIAAVGEAVDIGALWNRAYPTLSGGERQRVQLARTMAQLWRRNSAQPRYLLLDEPISALDLRHQHTTFAVLRRLAREGVGILTVIHDLQLAAAYADHVILLRKGRMVASGQPDVTLTPSLIEACFDVTVEIIRRPNGTIAICT